MYCKIGRHENIDIDERLIETIKRIFILGRMKNLIDHVTYFLDLLKSMSSWDVEKSDKLTVTVKNFVPHHNLFFY